MKKSYPLNHLFKRFSLLSGIAGLLCCWQTAAHAQTVTLNGGVVYRPFSSNTNFVVPGKTDVHFTADDSAYTNCTVALNANDAWLFYDNIRPAKVISSYLGTVTINGAPASNTTNPNVRIALYKNGTVVIPNGNTTSQAALEVFKQPYAAGTSQTYAVQTIHNNLGAFNNSIRSFKLKRGYMATLANNADGSGYSRVFVANDSDMVVNTMPQGLDTTVSFIRVFAWNWTSKKGKAGWDPDKIGCTWYYDWNIGGNSTAANYEYVAIRQTRWWPGYWDISNKPNVNQLLGFNEPDRPDQSNMSVDAAVAEWPELMKTGLRLGSPSPSDPFNGWLPPFLAKADALNYRVDFVAIHCYWGGFTPQQWYDRLRYVWEMCGRRPLWITEWNNGANWTNEYWPPNQNDQFQKQLNDMRGILQVLDTTSFVERYAEYDWVEDKRALVLGDTLTPAGKYYFANKSDFAYKPAWSFVHNWKLVAPTLNSNITDSNYFKVNLSWQDMNGETSSKLLLERRIEGRDAGFVPVQYFSNYNPGTTFSFTDSVYDRATYRIKTYATDTTLYLYSGELNVVRDIPATAPALTGSVVSSNKIRLNWNSVLHGRSYNLKRSTSATGPFDTIISARTTALGFTDENLTAGKTYYYVISSLNSAGESANSAVLAISTPVLAPPVAVAAPRAASGDTRVTLTWDFQYDARYRILRSLSAAGTYDTIASNLSSLRYVDSGRTNGTNYYYKIVAYNDSGYSPATPALATLPLAGQHLYLNLEDTASQLTAELWSGYHARFAGAATRTTGRYGQGLQLSGTADAYASLGEGAVSDLNNFTVATWVRPAALANWMRIFDFGKGTNNYMFLSIQAGTTGALSNIRYAIKNGGAEQILNYPYQVPLNAWTHFAITQSNDSTKLYINGVQVASTNGIGLRPFELGVTNQNYLGKAQFNDPLFNGAIDEFRIYNYALDSAQVNTLYNKVVVTAPTAVIAPRAASGDTQVTLTWTYQNDRQFAVLRSLSPAGTYDTVATNLATDRYIDNNRINGTSYYYRIVAFNTAGSASSPVLTTLPTRGQHLYISFNDDAAGIAEDSWGGYHAAFAGTATRGSNTAGKFLSLDAATGTAATIGTGVVSDLNNFTVATWVRPVALANWMRIFDFGRGTNNFMFLSIQAGTTGALSNIRYAIKNGGAEQILNYPYQVPLNAWTHFAITQSNDSTKLYINGVQVASTNGIGLRPFELGVTNQNYLGKAQFNDPLFNGAIDEFRIYNYALDSATIRNVYGIMPIAAPMAVRTPRVASGDGRATLTWGYQDDARYAVLRALMPNGPYDTIATNLSTLRYVDGNRMNNTDYYYKVLPSNAAGTGPSTSAILARPKNGQHVNISFDDNGAGMAEDNWNAYDASFANAAARETGRVGNALRLNGTSESYATLYNGVVSDLNDFTVSSWVKLRSTADWMRVFDFGAGTNNYMFLTIQAGRTGNLSNIRYAIKNGGGEQIVNYPMELPLNTWMHYAVTRSGNAVKLYIDGALVATNNNITIKPADLGMTNQNYLGKAQYNDPMLNGSIDEFRIYNYALNDQEIVNLTTGGILPFKLISFNGKTSPTHHLLSWQVNTASETIRLQLESSTDSRNYQPVYEVLTSNSSSTQSFQYAKVSGKEPVTYYRLRMTGQDGKITYSPIIALTQAVQGLEIVGLYPSIVATHASLSVTAARATPLTIVVTDVHGRTMLSATHTLVPGSNLLPLDASRLMPGIYYLSVLEGKNRLATNVRFVVNR